MMTTRSPPTAARTRRSSRRGRRPSGGWWAGGVPAGGTRAGGAGGLGGVAGAAIVGAGKTAGGGGGGGVIDTTGAPASVLGGGRSHHRDRCREQRCGRCQRGDFGSAPRAELCALAQAVSTLGAHGLLRRAHHGNRRRSQASARVAAPAQPWIHNRGRNAPRRGEASRTQYTHSPASRPLVIIAPAVEPPEPVANVLPGRSRGKNSGEWPGAVSRSRPRPGATVARQVQRWWLVAAALVGTLAVLVALATGSLSRTSHRIAAPPPPPVQPARVLATTRPEGTLPSVPTRASTLAATRPARPTPRTTTPDGVLRPGAQAAFGRLLGRLRVACKSRRCP